MSGNTISVRLHGHLVRYAGEKTSAFPVAIEAAETLAELVQRFGIPQAEISMIAINGRTAPRMDTPLHPSDQVSIFGLVGGG